MKKRRKETWKEGTRQKWKLEKIRKRKKKKVVNKTFIITTAWYVCNMSDTQYFIYNLKFRINGWSYFFASCVEYVKRAFFSPLIFSFPLAKIGHFLRQYFILFIPLYVSLSHRRRRRATSPSKEYTCTYVREKKKWWRRAFNKESPALWQRKFRLMAPIFLI